MSEIENSLDMNTLNDLRDMLDEGLDELLQEYLSDSPNQLQKLRAAVDGNDIAAIATVAHTLKGSSGNLGVSQLYQLCASLEKQARSGDLPDPAAAFAAIEGEFDRAKQALEIFMAK